MLWSCCEIGQCGLRKWIWNDRAYSLWRVFVIVTMLMFVFLSVLALVRGDVVMIVLVLVLMLMVMFILDIRTMVMLARSHNGCCILLAAAALSLLCWLSSSVFRSTTLFGRHVRSITS